ncbi:uncharacterized protein LOC121406137 [Lytechinus variegatus]|uniref:uncharacterized protein LOC121406137 n=1 Tax=Lytechinus variegatus TaxID=7654 RepID=UPI001BB1E9CF|nr:uncharacterized protein LOC121406137 [Lytechinus variegatus]
MSINTTSNAINVSSFSIDGELFDEDNLFRALNMIFRVMSAASGVLSLCTMLRIILHKNLRKQSSIIPFNIVLCDFISIALRYIPPSNKRQINVIIYTALLGSDLTSLLNILLVALQQFITIRVDPFGARGIITTPRTVAACVLSWIVPLSFTALLALNQTGIASIFLIMDTTILVTIGIFYLFLYRAISKGPPGVHISKQRKQENRQVFVTIVLVYVTTLIFRMMFRLLHLAMELFIGYQFLWPLTNIAITFSVVSNSLVYWWRLEEFRLILFKCKKYTSRPKKIDVLG